MIDLPGSSTVLSCGRPCPCLICIRRPAHAERYPVSLLRARGASYPAPLRSAGETRVGGRGHRGFNPRLISHAPSGHDEHPKGVRDGSRWFDHRHVRVRIPGAPEERGRVAGRGFLPPSVPEELARGCPRAFAVCKRHHAIDDDGLIALGSLDPAPLAAWEVIGDLTDPLGLDGQLVQTVHHHVGGCTFAQHTAVAEAGGLSWQG